MSFPSFSISLPTDKHYKTLTIGGAIIFLIGIYFLFESTKIIPIAFEKIGNKLVYEREFNVLEADYKKADEDLDYAIKMVDDFEKSCITERYRTKGCEIASEMKQRLTNLYNRENELYPNLIQSCLENIGSSISTTLQFLFGMILTILGIVLFKTGFNDWKMESEIKNDIKKPSK